MNISSTMDNENNLGSPTPLKNLKEETDVLTLKTQLKDAYKKIKELNELNKKLSQNINEIVEQSNKQIAYLKKKNDSLRRKLNDLMKLQNEKMLHEESLESSDVEMESDDDIPLYQLGNLGNVNDWYGCQLNTNSPDSTGQIEMNVKNEADKEVAENNGESNIATCEKKIDALRALMEQRLNQIQVQIDVIMEAQEEQNMLLRNFIDSQQDMRCRFPIKTSKKLKEINDEITPENRKSYINTVKALLKPGGIKKNLKYILSVDIVNEYNIDGVHGKLCLKDLKNFYDVVIDSIEVTSATPPADQQLREAIRLAKKRYLKSKSVSRARV